MEIVFYLEVMSMARIKQEDVKFELEYSIRKYEEAINGKEDNSFVEGMHWGSLSVLGRLLGVTWNNGNESEDKYIERLKALL